MSRNLIKHLQTNTGSWQDIVDMAGQIANGLIYLEEEGIIHGNLQAKHIFVMDRLPFCPLVKVHLYLIFDFYFFQMFRSAVSVKRRGWNTENLKSTAMWWRPFKMSMLRQKWFENDDSLLNLISGAMEWSFMKSLPRETDSIQVIDLFRMAIYYNIIAIWKLWKITDFRNQKRWRAVSLARSWKSIGETCHFWWHHL